MEYALVEEPDLISFADPDSSIPDNAIKALTNKYLLLKEWDNEIGGIGSSAFDLLTGRPISTYPNLIRRISHFKVYQLTYLMNSISLIPALERGQYLSVLLIGYSINIEIIYGFLKKNMYLKNGYFTMVENISLNYFIIQYL